MQTIAQQIATLDKNRDTPVDALQRLKAHGTRIVGVYCAFAPVELIEAAGALPVSLCGTSQEPIAHAEKQLPRNLCPLIKSSYGYAITGTCPYFFYSDLIVGETTCDGKKKMFELLARIAPVHVMQLPQTNRRPQDTAQWKAEIMRLKERLEQTCDVRVTDTALRDAIRRRNRERVLTREFYALSQLDPPPLAGSQVHRVLRGADFALDRDHRNCRLQALLAAVTAARASATLQTPAGRPRILLTGCPVGGDTEKIIRIIEENGGTIVCFENCAGAKNHEELVDETGDPYDALARKYVRLGCSCMSPNNHRLELLDRLIDTYAIDGVIDVVLQACHTYNIETCRIREFVHKQKHTSYMSIETDYSQADEGQLRTRISAFIEMLH